MATKTVTMSVCDLCGKSVEELKNSLTFNGIEYNEVCDECAKKVGMLVTKLQTPQISQYMKRKAKLAAEGK